jgi:hypothetical protein
MSLPMRLKKGSMIETLVPTESSTALYDDRSGLDFCDVGKDDGLRIVLPFWRRGGMIVLELQCFFGCIHSGAYPT